MPSASLAKCGVVPGAAGAVGDLVRLGLGGGNELAQRLELRVRLDYHRHRREHEGADGDHVVRMVERQLLEDVRQQCEGGVVGHQRIAVGRRLHGLRHADRSGGAGLVLDEEGLADLLLQLGRHLARDHVDGAAGA